MRSTPHTRSARFHAMTRRTVTAGLLLAGVALTGGCASSSHRASASPVGEPPMLTYRSSYAAAPSKHGDVLIAGDTLGLAMFEDGAVTASRTYAELRYAGVTE